MPFPLPDKLGNPCLVGQWAWSLLRSPKMSKSVAPQTCGDYVVCGIRPLILLSDQMLSRALQIFGQPDRKLESNCKLRRVFLPHWKLAVIAEAALLFEGQTT